MQRFGDAVIPMQPNFEKIRYLVGNENILRNISNTVAMPIFYEEVISFLDSLSKKLLKDKEARKYPDLIAFAFWIRKESLLSMAEKYNDGKSRIGRGVVFHITPSNIPVQFAVSMVYALIAGDASVIRVSDREFEQADIICLKMKELLDSTYECLKNHLCIVRYPHDDEITGFFSMLCDVRMIWGGDNTINAVRKNTVNPRCIDLGFADRYSLCVIDSDAYLDKDSRVIAEDFYNDTFFNDQNACSSPCLVVWTGKRTQEAKSRFWDTLNEIVKQKYNLDPIMSSEKLLKTAVCAAVHPEIEQIKRDNYIVRIEIPELYDDVIDYRGNCGYFFEYETSNLDDLLPLFTKKCQTVVYVGNLENELHRLVLNNGVRGVDRIVPVGHGTDISLVWDGLDLPDILSRRVGNS